MDVGFENTCTVSGKWDISRVVTWLYGWVYKILKTTGIISSTAASYQWDSHSTESQSVVITAGFQTRGTSSNLMSSQFSIRHMPSFTFPTTFLRTIAELLSTKDPDSWLLASSFKDIVFVHILLYIFLIVFYSYCIYVVTTTPHKGIFCYEIHNIITSI